MKTRFNFSRHIRDCFAYYLLALIVTPILVTYFVQLKTNPKDYEKFTVFVGSTYKDEYAFKKYLLKILPEDLDIYFYHCEESDSTFLTQVTSRAYNSDLTILSTTGINRVTDLEFLDLSSSSKYSFEPNYKREESIYGLTLKNSSKNLLSDYINYNNEETYHAFIPKKSVHLKGIVDDSGKTDQVSRVLNEVFSL